MFENRTINKFYGEGGIHKEDFRHKWFDSKVAVDSAIARALAEL